MRLRGRSSSENEKMKSEKDRQSVEGFGGIVPQCVVYSVWCEGWTEHSRISRYAVLISRVT